MHVLMLGWEFPPYITGGLGTACQGLTKALNQRDVKITFLLPKAIGTEAPSHINLIGTDTPRQPMTATTTEPTGSQTISEISDDLTNTEFIEIEAGFANPYARPAQHEFVERQSVIPGKKISREVPIDPITGNAIEPEDTSMEESDSDYGGDLLSKIRRYASFCLKAAKGLEFDVIHAHDWMTFPAGLLLARATGRPLVCHVHSTEFDRSGEHPNQMIYDIERRGAHGAMRVIAVSRLTQDLLVYRYGMDRNRISVVYNGVDLEPTQNNPKYGIKGDDKIVLYLGRITMQKGPEYFIQAAARVLEVMKNVKFVVAGDGDMARSMIEMAAKLGIGHKVLFTGFLRGKDIERVFQMADLYVMPSVSEPFGIAPLEAMIRDVPVLISKSSGVSEVLTHALKVDFWDTDAMANKIVAVLRHPPLGNTLRKQGAFEVRGLNWEGAAERVDRVYNQVVDAMKANSITAH